MRVRRYVISLADAWLARHGADGQSIVATFRLCKCQTPRLQIYGENRRRFYASLDERPIEREEALLSFDGKLEGELSGRPTAA